MNTANQHEEGTGPIFLQSIRATLGRVPLWLLVAGALAALSLPAGLLVHGAMADALEHAYAPGSTVRALDVQFVTDHTEARAGLDESTAAVGAVAALLSMLLGIFAAGGWLQVFLERTGGHSVRSFFHGGVGHFWRFLRVFVLVVLGAAAIQRAVYHEPWHALVEARILGLPALAAPGSDTGPEYSTARLEELPDEASARRVVWIQDGIHAAALALLLTWAIYTRTRLALHDASSSVWAGLCTFFTLLRHPVRTLRPMLLLFGVEIAVVIVATSLHTWIEEQTIGPTASWKSVAAIGALSMLVLTVSEIVHAARYHAAIQVSRRVIGPIARPDPWKHSIGAPGGPQYPIFEGSDEYGVSL